MAAKGFITVELYKTDGNGTIEFHLRPEIVSMYRGEKDTTLVWFDPMDSPFICAMDVDEFEAMLMVSTL